MAGRKLAFEREEALKNAMDLFWEKGYHAAGLTELLERMGIKRQSLYNTFGNKHQLFLEAIVHYGQTVIKNFEIELLKPGSTVANIEAVFDTILLNSEQPGCRGCFVVNTLIELAPHDPEVAQEVERISKKIEKAFEMALRQAIAIGELPHNFPIKPMARYLYHIVLGLHARTKGIPDSKELRETLDIALAVLHPTKNPHR